MGGEWEVALREDWPVTPFDHEEEEEEEAP